MRIIFHMNINAILNKDLSFTKGRKRINDKHKLIIFSNLSLMINSGLSISEAFDILNQDIIEKSKTKVIVNALYKDITRGELLSQSMIRIDSFNKYEIFNVQVGEETGQLGASLENLATYLESKIELKQKITSALSYPIVVLITALLAIVFMLKTVVPMFETIFSRFGQELPAITQTIISISNNTIPILLISLTLFIAIIVLNKVLVKNEFYLFVKYRLLLSIPVFGQLINKINLSRFSTSMGLFLSTGIPIMKAVSISKEMSTYYPLIKALTNIENDLSIGRSFFDSMNSQNVFDKRLVAMVKVGMETNMLEDIFSKSAINYNKDISHTTSVANSILEPLLIIIIGVIVAVILVSMYLPIFKLSTSFNF
jgi:type IV pilus assembly protein PilC